MKNHMVLNDFIPDGNIYADQLKVEKSVRIKSFDFSDEYFCAVLTLKWPLFDVLP